MLCLNGFELYSRWVPLKALRKNKKPHKIHVRVYRISRVKDLHGKFSMEFQEISNTSLGLK